jgi:hypothetical protein
MQSFIMLKLVVYIVTAGFKWLIYILGLPHVEINVSQ